MKAVLGNNVDVRALTETTLIEVKDIDETTDKTDILCAVQSQFDVELPESAVVNLRVAYGDTQTATIRVTPDIGRRLLEKGKVRLGWTWCRVRPKLTPKRCFKCMEFNHIAGNCRVQEDCSECCYNCGAKEHQARGCKAKAYCMLCKRKKEKDCDQPTFSKAGTSSIIDLTFVNAGLASDSSWEVSDTYTSSDHATIICTINSRNGPPRVPKTVPG